MFVPRCPAPGPSRGRRPGAEDETPARTDGRDTCGLARLSFLTKPAPPIGGKSWSVKAARPIYGSGWRRKWRV